MDCVLGSVSETSAEVPVPILPPAPLLYATDMIIFNYTNLALLPSCLKPFNEVLL